MPIPTLVMPGLDPGIFYGATKKDTRIKSGCDETHGVNENPYRFSAATSCATSPLRLDRKDVKIPRWR